MCFVHNYALWAECRILNVTRGGSSGTTVPAGVEWHLHPACCGAILGPWSCRSERKWIADRLARSGSAQRFVGPEPFLGVSRQIIRRKMKRWMEKQHPAWWGGPCSTHRQAREVICGPNLATGAWLLSFNRTQSRVVVGLLTGHNTLRRHLHIMGLW
jgi:hypothetical protein